MSNEGTHFADDATLQRIAELRAENAALKEDAEKWRAYEKRRDEFNRDDLYLTTENADLTGRN